MNEQDKHTFILNYLALREEICLNSLDFSLKNDSSATEMFHNSPPFDLFLFITI